MPQTHGIAINPVSAPLRVQWAREDCARFLERDDLKPGRRELRQTK